MVQRVPRAFAKAVRGFEREEGAPLRIEKKHQIATFADFCNECGNCDVFCLADGRFRR